MCACVRICMYVYSVYMYIVYVVWVEGNERRLMMRLRNGRVMDATRRSLILATKDQKKKWRERVEQ